MCGLNELAPKNAKNSATDVSNKHNIAQQTLCTGRLDVEPSVSVQNSWL